jgi:hypothetical protein
MTTNIDKLHQAGTIDKDKLTQDHIDAINGLSDEELAHIESVYKNLTPEERAVAKIVGGPV